MRDESESDIDDTELHGDPAEGEEVLCPGCGLPRTEWSARQGKGIRREGELFCCRPCADELPCVCALIQAEGTSSETEEPEALTEEDAPVPPGRRRHAS